MSKIDIFREGGRERNYKEVPTLTFFGPAPVSGPDHDGRASRIARGSVAAGFGWCVGVFLLDSMLLLFTM